MCPFNYFLDSVLFHHDGYDYHRDSYGHSINFSIFIWAFCNQVVLVLQIRTFLDVSVPGHSL